MTEEYTTHADEESYDETICQYTLKGYMNYISCSSSDEKENEDREDESPSKE